MKPEILLLTFLLLGSGVAASFSQTDSSLSQQHVQKESRPDSNAVLARALRPGVFQDRVAASQTTNPLYTTLRPRLSLLLKYDTTPANYEHRCYEIVKPLSRGYNFLFNFMSNQKFKYGGSR